MKIYTNRMVAIIPSILFLLTLLSGSALCASNEKESAVPNCDIQSDACIQELDGGYVTLEILPRPVEAMKDLAFRVSLENLTPTEDPGIDLGMPGMSMGPNHVTLEKGADGVYEGTGVIVRCPSGKTLWQADVSIPGAGTSLFIFDVVY